MPSRSLYQQTLVANGSSQRQREINQMKRKTLADLINSPSCKTVSIAGVDDNLIVIDTKDTRIKSFNSMPNKSYPLGTVVDWSSKKWLMTAISEDKEIYQSGTIKQCNHLFRFQNLTSAVLEYWGIIETPQASLDEEKIVTVLSSKLKVTLPYNADTCKIHIDKRLFVETRFDANGKEIPVIYKVNNIISANSDYGNGKLFELTLEEVGASTNDNITEKIADYISPITPPIPPTPDPMLLKCEIIGSSSLKAGGSTRKFEAKFYLADGMTLDTTIAPIWQLVSYAGHESFYTTSQNGNFIGISAADNTSIIDTEIKLVLTDSGGLYNPSEFIIKVVSAF